MLAVSCQTVQSVLVGSELVWYGQADGTVQLMNPDEMLDGSDERRRDRRDGGATGSPL
jgi:hypothetical protein